ncbi:hypothetical protein [Cytobacillus praedii]|uniref:Lipoprotein n=1 Tax=Cytobacillus praedii TaxID=1742358 RepID=A0A4R1ARE1_9BACI|nr:hypothetical protein [Cytobacillus praedii]TCJ02135.1 hypothetical protein E0Y62_20930 [Cytobacillus praedii]
MKKTIMIVMLSVLFLVGCGYKFISFSGESDNWKGEYATNIEGSSENGTYTLGYKNAPNNLTFKNLEILIDGVTRQKMEEYNRAIIKIPTSCSGCLVTTENSTIKVTIKWNNINEETFYLESGK